MAKKVGQIRRDALSALKHVQRSDAGEHVVHALRTGLRRFEALSSKPLPKKLERVRKRAGKVRDCDVLLRLAAGFSIGADARGAIEKRLLKRRKKDVRKLMDSAARVSRSGSKKWAKKHLRAREDSLAVILRDAGAQISKSQYPDVGEESLHEFRLVIKPLRYRSEMLDGQDAEAMAAQFDAVQ